LTVATFADVSIFIHPFQYRLNPGNGMEEVIGSIPIRSTNQLNNLGRAFSGAGQTFV
jgi:hypothetical protein